MRKSLSDSVNKLLGEILFKQNKLILCDLTKLIELIYFIKSAVKSKKKVFI